MCIDAFGIVFKGKIPENWEILIIYMNNETTIIKHGNEVYTWQRFSKLWALQIKMKEEHVIEVV